MTLEGMCGRWLPSKKVRLRRAWPRLTTRTLSADQSADHFPLDGLLIGEIRLGSARLGSTDYHPTPVLRRHVPYLLEKHGTGQFVIDSFIELLL